MELLVLIKQVPDTTEIRIDPETNTLIRAGVPSIVNPFDKNALEAAVQLKEKHGGSVTVMTMGPKQAAAALRECYSLGADRMVLICDNRFVGSDTYSTSYVLSQVIRKLGGFDLILCGKQAIDGDTAQVGPEVAEHLDLPQITYACELEVSGDTLRAKRELDNYYTLVETTLPAVVTVVKSINEPRLPNVMRRLSANRMEPECITCDDLETLDLALVGLKGSPTKVFKTFVPSRSKQTVMIDGSKPEQAAQKLLLTLASAGIRL